MIKKEPKKDEDDDAKKKAIEAKKKAAMAAKKKGKVEIDDRSSDEQMNFAQKLAKDAGDKSVELLRGVIIGTVEGVFDAYEES